MAPSGKAPETKVERTARRSAQEKKKKRIAGATIKGQIIRKANTESAVGRGAERT